MLLALQVLGPDRPDKTLYKLVKLDIDEKVVYKNTGEKREKRRRKVI
jgi:hypothetical protein